MTIIGNLADGLLHYLYPQVCEGCRQPLLHGEKTVCISCISAIQRIPQGTEGTYETELRLAGRFPYHHAVTLAYLHPENILHDLLHALKYRGKKEVGLWIGMEMGIMLQQFVWTQHLDAIIPVPLHASRMHKRGYNQSELIAEGIRSVTGIPVKKNLIKRSIKTPTQTHLSREERWNNVRDAFVLTGAELPGKILLLDDVLTTGATLEACVGTIQKNSNAEISIATTGLAI